MSTVDVLDKGHTLTHAKDAVRHARRNGATASEITRLVRQSEAAHRAYTEAWGALGDAERRAFGMIPWRTCQSCA